METESQTNGPERRLFGRRRAHKLRAAQQDRLDRLLPEFEITLPGSGFVDPMSLFTEDHSALSLEIGFGSGEHLAAQALAHPDTAFIGVEPFINGLASALRRIEESHLSNVRIFADDARLLLHRLPNACLDSVFVLFPDPWPKARHFKRRLISAGSLVELSRTMRPGAVLHFATDDMSYVSWTLGLLINHPDFTWQAESPRDWRRRPADGFPTRYEEKALNAGRACIYLRFRRL